MGNATSKYLLPQEDESELSPAMRALNIQQRRFVTALFENPGHGAGARAARAAGYGHAKSKALTFARQANRLFNDPKVQRAIAEQTARLLRSEAPQAVQAVREIMGDKDHKDRLKAANLVLERLDPTETRHHVDVVHRAEPSIDDLVRWMRHFRDDLNFTRDQLNAMFGGNRMPLLEEREAELVRRNYFKAPGR
jgi:phage terminase small subunit